jgi:hypothetical protein
MNWQVAAMAQTPVAANLNQSLYMHLHITPQLTFNLVILVDEFSD